MTVLMHNWYYEKKDIKHSPSVADGISVERESRYRREGARFIYDVGNKMGLRYDTISTGVVYFHRFYMFHSFKTFPRYVTACCCLFLAGKVEETPKKCKDIIRTAKSFLAESQFAQFGDNPKEEVMTLERILLQTIKFDLQVDHPHGYLLKYAKSLIGDEIQKQDVVQMAWNFINDSLRTTLCLQFEPEIIAIALMHLAGKLSKFEVVDWIGRTPLHKDWWDMFVEGMTIDLLEDICHQVLDDYSAPNPNIRQDSPPATPPTKQTRITSQLPSPVETATSPAPMKPKDPLIGISKLEPSELKRKSSHLGKETVPKPVKIPRMTEGKVIPTISSHSPRTAPNNVGPDNHSSSPSISQQESVKSMKENPRATSELVFKTSIVPNQPSFAVGSPVQASDSSVAKPGPHVSQAIVTSVPHLAFTQSNTTYFTEAQPFPNMQQPPPQMFVQHALVSFQQLPPVPPSGPPAPPPPPPPDVPPPAFQYIPTMPPDFNCQYPPPPQHFLSNPAFHGMIQHPPPNHLPLPSMMHNVPPPPTSAVHSVPLMGQDRPYHNQLDVYNSDQHGHPPKSMNQNFAPHRQFEGHQGSNYDFPHNPSFCRPPPGYFNHDLDQSSNTGSPQRFLLNPQGRKQEQGLLLLSPMGNPPQHRAPTGIPPV